MASSDAASGRRVLPFPSSAAVRNGHGRPSSLLSSALTSIQEEKTAKQKHHHYENYDKPVVLIGLSSSPWNDELTRLAVILSGALAGNDPRRLRGAMDELEHSQEAGSGLVGEEGGDDDVGEASGGAPIDDSDAEDRPRGEEEGKVVGISCRASPGS